MSMREKMAAARFHASMKRCDSPMRWEHLPESAQAFHLQDMDAALDCLTAPPSAGMIATAREDGKCGGYGFTDEECFAADPAEVWEAMVSAMIAEGK